MPKNKKQKLGSLLPPKFKSCDKPSENCHEFVIQLIVKFYEDNTPKALESKYVKYGEQGLDKFKNEITQMIMNALHVTEWMEETHKPGYMKFLEDRANDAL